MTGFSGSDGKVERMHAVRVEGGFDGPEPLPGTEHDINCDLVLLAIGFTGPVHNRLLDDLALGYTEKGNVPAQDGFATKEKGVFVAGDAKRGASLIVWAISEGRKAARQADVYLMGESLLP